MQALRDRCAEWGDILSLGLEKLEGAGDMKGTDSFHVAQGKGGRVIGLWGDTGAPTLVGEGKATAEGTNSVIIIGENVSLTKTRFQVSGRNSAIIIGPGCNLKGLQISIKGHDCLVVIGAGTTWESGAAICDSGQSIIVGDDCMFSSGVILRTSDGHSLWEAGGAARISTPRSVVIHPHVWLGNSVRVSKGAVVGTGTTVGQLSLVTGKLASYSVYGGVPARLIRSNTEWSRTFAYEDIPERFRAPKPIKTED